MSDSSDPDSELFRAAVTDVKRLRTDRKEHPGQQRPEPRAKFTRADEARVLEQSLEDAPDWAPETGEELAWRGGGVRESDYRKLRRGELKVAAEIDLHGMSAAEARVVLGEFLAGCQSRGQRCVRVIHGKGNRSGQRGPVLKRKIGRWLRRRADVLAFHSARPVDGGTGALYVLLRRR